jgi:hypothetical protein
MGEAVNFSFDPYCSRRGEDEEEANRKRLHNLAFGFYFVHREISRSSASSSFLLA